MTAQEPSTLKTLLVHAQLADANSHSAYRLLNEMGHDVSTAGSATEALELLQHEPADLVIVDADDSARRDLVARLTDLPSDQQPRQVAIFSDTLDDALNNLASKLQRSRVHVLLRPLHMHGLLGILRHIEARSV